MAGRKKRGRRHPGVVIIKPDEKARAGWRARWKDPDSRKTRRETFPTSVTTAEQRTEWCVNKSHEIRKRADELKGGALRASGKLLSDAVDAFFKAKERELSDRTRDDYRAAADKLVAWAKETGIESVDNLTRARLIEFRTALVNEPKRGVVKGKGVGRGKRLDTDAQRSPVTINTEMRKAGTVLYWLIDADWCPRLTTDDLRRALKPLDVPTERNEYLRVPELRKLFEATMRHDDDTHVETREEHRGKRPKGTTPKYDAIAPVVAFTLLTGMRLGEVLGLDWQQVDLDSGDIHLEGKTTKTRTYREVDLGVSPALKKLLAALKLSTGGKGSVFGLTEGLAEAAAKRLRTEYGAPDSFTWQALRRSCSSYLTCAPNIFGAASAARSAFQLGHSIKVAESAYLSPVKNIPPGARDLESAMQIGDLVNEVVRRVSEPQKLTRKAVV